MIVSKKTTHKDLIKYTERQNINNNPQMLLTVPTNNQKSLASTFGKLPQPPHSKAVAAAGAAPPNFNAALLSDQDGTSNNDGLSPINL